MLTVDTPHQIHVILIYLVATSPILMLTHGAIIFVHLP
jgi:hypothetical protein